MDLVFINLAKTNMSRLVDAGFRSKFRGTGLESTMLSRTAFSLLFRKPDPDHSDQNTIR